MSNQTGCQRGDGIGPPPEWPQDRLERFWRGLGIEERRNKIGDLYACYLVGSDLIPWEDDGKGWLDLYDKRVGLEILLYAMKALDREAFIIPAEEGGYRGDAPLWEKSNNRKRLAKDPDFRAAIIAAIEKLLEVKDG